MVGQEAATEFVPLREVAQLLHIKTGRLAQMSRKGKFCTLLRVSQKHYLVRRDELAAWMASRHTATAELQVQAVKAARTGRQRRAAKARR